MERIICNHCEKEIGEHKTPWHIEARRDVNTFCDDRDSFNLCDVCYKKVFKVKDGVKDVVKEKCLEDVC